MSPTCTLTPPLHHPATKSAPHLITLHHMNLHLIALHHIIHHHISPPLHHSAMVLFFAPCKTCFEFRSSLICSMPFAFPNISLARNSNWPHRFPICHRACPCVSVRPCHHAPMPPYHRRFSWPFVCRSSFLRLGPFIHTTMCLWTPLIRVNERRPPHHITEALSKPASCG